MGNNTAAFDNCGVHYRIREFGEADHSGHSGKICDTGISVLHGGKHLLAVFFVNTARYIQHVRQQSCDNGESILSAPCVASGDGLFQLDCLRNTVSAVCGYLDIFPDSGRNGHQAVPGLVVGFAVDCSDDDPFRRLGHHYIVGDYKIPRSGTVGGFPVGAVALWMSDCLWASTDTGAISGSVYAQPRDAHSDHVPLRRVWLWLFQPWVLSNQLGNQSHGVSDWSDSVQPY